MQMSMDVSSMPVSHFVEVTNNIDLSLVKKKLMSSSTHGGQEWPEDLADEVIPLYKKYLALCLAYPSKKLVPTRDIDMVWHYHILDTKKYSEDCKEYFGYFLHHNPNYSPETVGGEYKSSAKETVEMFVKHFGCEPKGKHMLCSGFSCDPGECSS